MKYELDRIGKVISGDDIGSFVRVLDDRESTGGFLIFLTLDPLGEIGFDDWVESESALERYFLESRWIIDWGTDWLSG